MDMNFIVLAAAADPQGWRFFAGMDEAKHPVWAPSEKAVHFPTFKQASRLARRVGGEVCASINQEKTV